MAEEHELGLETLTAVKSKLGVNLEDSLLKSCFYIQKKHQFNNDMTLSVKAMEKLIDSYVEKNVSTHSKDEP